MNTNDNEKNIQLYPTKIDRFDIQESKKKSQIRQGIKRPQHLKKSVNRLSPLKKKNYITNPVITRTDLIEEFNNNREHIAIIKLLKANLKQRKETAAKTDNTTDTNTDFLRTINTPEKQIQHLKKLKSQNPYTILDPKTDKLGIIHTYEEEYKIKLANDRFLRNAWEELLIHPKNRFYFTISFFAGTPDQTCRDGFQFIYNQICRAVYGKNHRRRKKFVNGMFVSERQINGTLHFHCVLRDDTDFFNNLPQFKRIIYTAIKKLKSSYNDMVAGELITNPDCVHIRNYDSRIEKELSDYCTKAFEEKAEPIHKRSRNIGFMGKHGLLFGEIDRKK